MVNIIEVFCTSQKESSSPAKSDLPYFIHTVAGDIRSLSFSGFNLDALFCQRFLTSPATF
jgi:hypothetical protein